MRMDTDRERQRERECAQFQSAVDEALSEIKIDGRFRSRMIDAAKQGTRPRRRRLASRILLAACLCIVMAGAMMAVAAAAGVPAARQLAEYAGEQFSLMLEPVQESCEDNGIALETVAALSDGEETVVYFTLQDLRREGRIGPDTEVDSYHIAGADSLSCQLVEYDPQTEKALFCMRGNGGKDMDNRKVSLSIRSIIHTCTEEENLDTGIDLYEMLRDAPPAATATVDWFNGIAVQMGETELDIENEERDQTMLATDKMNLSIPGIDWMHISNIGFVDGKLHIQVNPDNDFSGYYSHGSFYFTDEQGQKLEIREIVKTYGSFHLEEPFGNLTRETEIGGDYEEYIFDLSDVEDLKGLSLRGNFSSYEGLTDGDWSITFRVKGVQQNVTECSQDLAEGIVTRISVSQLGVTIEGEEMEMAGRGASAAKESGSRDENLLRNAVITLLDGNGGEIPQGSSYSSSGGGKITVKIDFTDPGDAERIAAVQINETAIPLKGSD